mmetsp:Transcript_67334/g.105283  ORF Transcript_67334/g.105283 Transcript_67334/m.105283 type:complete len:192 (+) Transcript_67334:28-603(+)
MGLIPNSLWAWIDSDIYAYQGFTHALFCHRPAWFYQRCFPKAPLHQLSKEVFPSNYSFWATWAFCPQMINLKILRTHFTAHTWLNWTYFSMDIMQLIDMIVRPRANLKNIPLKCVGLLCLWGFRGFWLSVVSDYWAHKLERMDAYLSILYLPALVAFDVAYLSGIVALVWTGKLSKNPLEWEAQLEGLQKK